MSDLAIILVTVGCVLPALTVLFVIADLLSEVWAGGNPTRRSLRDWLIIWFAGDQPVYVHARVEGRIANVKPDTGVYWDVATTHQDVKGPLEIHAA